MRSSPERASALLDAECAIRPIGYSDTDLTLPQRISGADARLPSGGSLAQSNRIGHLWTIDVSLHLSDPPRHCRPRNPQRRHHNCDPATTQRDRLSPQQKPTLPLIKLRHQHSELRRQHLIQTRLRHPPNVSRPHRRSPQRNTNPTNRNLNVIHFHVLTSPAGLSFDTVGHSPRPRSGGTRPWHSSPEPQA